MSFEILGCSSYSALKEAIEYIFTSAAKINVVVCIITECYIENLSLMNIYRKFQLSLMKLINFVLFS